MVYGTYILYMETTVRNVNGIRDLKKYSFMYFTG